MKLYLSLQLQTAALFLILFLLSLPQLIDSHRRGSLRNRCRAALASSYDALTHANSSSAVLWHAGCGYAGIGIRHSVKAIPQSFGAGPLTGTLGMCSEYSDRNDGTMPIPFRTDPRSLFVDLPQGAALCAHGSLAEVGFFFQFLSAIVLMAYLGYWRYQVRAQALYSDRASVTTGDFAVLLRELSDGLGESASESATRSAAESAAESAPKSAAESTAKSAAESAAKSAGGRLTPEALEAALYADLEEMGFGRERIAQLEVGRVCREEIGLLQRLEKLNISKHELAARRVLR